MKKKKLTLLYIFSDLLAALLAWILFFIYRKNNVDDALFSHFSISILDDVKLFIGMALCPLYWFVLHTFSGYYNKITRKSRLKELETTLVVIFFGTLLFFFAFILDDIINTPSDYLRYFFTLFALQFFFTYVPRVLITTRIISAQRRGKLTFNSLLIGSDATALSTYRSVIQQDTNVGRKLVGYVPLGPDEEHLLPETIPFLGELEKLDELIVAHNIEEVIIAVYNGKRKFTELIIAKISALHDRNIDLKLLPESQDFLLGNVKISSALSEPFISIYPSYLPDWQRYMKRMCDIFFSFLAIILLLPLYLILAVGVKLSSSGPIIYKQERVGFKGRTFNIYKFRSMVVGAERGGQPQLSSKDDPRITPYGRFLRKTRLDETPQFVNVLLGDMSLVGPRPERQFYIDEIIKQAPYYKLLLNIKPGITSLGQVKFGYAENVDEMVQRLKWDMLYIENMSLQMDIKILIYTILIVLERKGK